MTPKLSADLHLQGIIPTKDALWIYNSDGHMIAEPWAVRRLTPRECERLQGMPDDHTLISWRGKDPTDCPDGPRYKAIGNSMAVPVMKWIIDRVKISNDQHRNTNISSTPEAIK